MHIEGEVQKPYTQMIQNGIVEIMKQFSKEIDKITEDLSNKTLDQLNKIISVSTEETI